MLPHVVTVKLNGWNYMVWQKLVRHYVASQMRLPHIDGTATPPPRRVMVTVSDQEGKKIEVPQSNPEYNRWYANDMQVVSWLLSTLSGEKETRTNSIVFEIVALLPSLQRQQQEYLISHQMQHARPFLLIEYVDLLVGLGFKEQISYYDIS